MIAGFFYIFQISPAKLTESIFRSLAGNPKSIKDQADTASQRKKANFLVRQIRDTQEILDMTGKTNQFPKICAVSLAAFLTGTFIAVLFDNIFMIPPLAGGMTLLPFWYVQMTAHHFKKDIAAELETALSIITTAYIRNEDIITAVQENISYLLPPAQNVFKSFLSQLLVDPDMNKAIRLLRTKIDNAVFHEWCDALSACQADRSLKSTLTPIVNKLSDIRIVNSELDLMVFEPRKEFIIMVLLVIGNIPLMYLLNKSWYELLMFSTVGKILLAVSTLAIFISTAFVLRFTRPIEYRR